MQCAHAWVDVKFDQRLEHPPTLLLIKHLVSLTSLPGEISYIGDKGFKALKEMALVNRGRLSEVPDVGQGQGWSQS